jgi:hypothetical protein
VLCIALCIGCVAVVCIVFTGPARAQGPRLAVGGSVGGLGWGLGGDIGRGSRALGGGLGGGLGGVLGGVLGVGGSVGATGNYGDGAPPLLTPLTLGGLLVFPPPCLPGPTPYVLGEPVARRQVAQNPYFCV